MYSFLSPFLPCRTERKLQKLDREGFLLTSIRRDVLLYTLCFDEAEPQNYRYFVYRMDDSGKALVRPMDPREVTLIEIAPLCERVFECDGFSFVGRVRKGVPEDVLRSAIRKRMMCTFKYHLECLAVWIAFPIVFQIVVSTTNAPWQWGSVFAGTVLMGAIYLYHLTAAAISYLERKKAKGNSEGL